MRTIILFVSLLIFASVTSPISAGAEAKEAVEGEGIESEGKLPPGYKAPKEVEIDGLVIDYTQTRVGYDFFQGFVTYWEAPRGEGIEDYNIVITERASPTWGSWIWVTVNEIIVYQNILKPRSGDIVEAAKQGVETVRQYLLSAFRDGTEIEDIDLKGKDL